MTKAQLVFVLHGHQPSGNFDSIIEQACRLCYGPVLESLAQHPQIHMGLHLSGCLLEWLEDHEEKLFDSLASLVSRGQVELLGGAMYEPVLPALPEADAYAQLELHSAYLEDRFSVRPRGAWLAERIWEPALAGMLSRSGYAYTLLDDSAFFQAGPVGDRLSGHWVTDQGGDPLALFPIDRRLRYAIPFQPVHELFDGFRVEYERRGPFSFCYGDDWEKLGMWPGTHEWVFGQGWLTQFLERLEEAADWLEVVTPSESMATRKPEGRIYPPTASYDELTLWTLPAKAIERHLDWLEQQEQSELPRPPASLGLSAPWQNFMAKYPEANHMHKRMVQVSRKLAEALSDDEDWQEEHEDARLALYRGQCACAYWHGAFGGIYLPHLRTAVYRDLLEAEDVLDRRAQGGDDWIGFDQIDFDGDLREEVVVETPLINAYIDPDRGGTLVELDFRPARANLVDVMTRRQERYSDHGPGPRGGQQVDEMTQMAEAAIADQSVRRCFTDRFPALESTLDDIQRMTYQEEGDFINGAYEISQAGIDEEGDCDFELVLTRRGQLSRGGREIPLVLEKRIHIPADEARLELTYRLHNPNEAAVDLLFCPELNLRLPGGDPAQQVFEFSGLMGGYAGPPIRSAGELDEASWIAMMDPVRRLRVEAAFDPPACIWRYPVETVCRSLQGLEKHYQGSAILPRWELTVPPHSDIHLTIRLAIAETDQFAVVPLSGSEEANPEVS